MTKTKDIYRSLNLRKLNREPGQITLNGKTHDFLTPTEADMLSMMTAATFMKTVEADTPEEQEQQLNICKQLLMDKVLSIIPTLYGEEVTFTQLMAILDLFVEMRNSLNE